MLYPNVHEIWYSSLSVPTGHFIRSEEHKRKISQALKGRHYPERLGEKITKICLCGKEFSRTPSKFKPGHGKYCSRSCTYKYQTAFAMSKLSHKLKGEEHWNYKGNKAGYKALHLRVGQMRGKANYCSDDPSHKSTKYEWANLTGKYEDPNDYKSLCHKCHNKFDNVAKKGWETKRKIAGK